MKPLHACIHMSFYKMADSPNLILFGKENHHQKMLAFYTCFPQNRF